MDRKKKIRAASAPASAEKRAPIYSPVTTPLLEKAMALRWRDGPPDLALVIKQCVLDWLGVSIAAAAEPAAKILRAELTEQGGYPQAHVFGGPKRMPIQQAALLNGTISHMLDYDDVNFALPGHVTAPILPAVLALAEHRGANGAAAMDAFLTGYETACRIGRLVAPGHYTGGFHATATIGSFGSAAACARLLGLDRHAAARALGIAATRAAGLKSMFGTSCKPLHAGAAAATGLFAATLAARGFDAPEDALECAQGFAATHSPDFDAAAALRDPTEGYHLFANLFKFHSACYETLGTIECGHELRQTHRLSPEEIRAVRVRANSHCNEICNIAEPRTGVETKFSLRATAAFALTGLETFRPEVFSDANANSTYLNALRDKVSVELTPDLGLTVSEMEVELVGGRILRTRHDSGIPMNDRTTQGTRVADKFHALVAPILGKDRSGRIAATVGRLETLPHLGSLMRLCV
jgi:2-methylcitrate dehydratase PrpD